RCSARPLRPLEELAMRYVQTAWTAALVCALSVLAACGAPTSVRPAADAAPVLLVCEHGSVKSLIAASLFNQAAAARGLPFRAVSRGVTPDAAVPEKIAAELGGEGFDVKNFKPARVSATDVSNASRVVAIGVDVSPFTGAALVPVEHWDDVPAASADYAA